ncbi:MAG TPA: branched-chain amino acid ABC transporter permease [Alcanivorax sp.]|jgi:branched-chain amino acid transport system permease protein|uniref:ABC transporter permease n=2 Tax=Alloalcanivorax venustensis TaxID=172371 RepID=A0ABS0AF69_9GAMM|nr:branched-chain amino acid ABC transporter permease [Alloalcanivorax venustensis]MAQ34391.1 branched-chain amino acid ABC transporter permease [Alcanivorax sp.]MBA4731848.1 branched-chain amino acid ABC transporter permease [Alcanivorax sp.]MBF5052718.1 ABC transporter permease [Alloalcanivorax venustensis ISO4]MCH2553008.1 branched-chain amino acid ABC transporter permease [Alcanivorax sp.]HAD46460.1 branched-chain amino acid ABC transporter permease [Alcanivorax sp.]|tara:strand:- start:5941 stop:6975 length:1035 start_codon:yes stop_codon:yes gene_type:complete
MDRIANFFASPAMKVVLLAFALIFPLIAGSEYQIYVMALAFIWAIAVYGLNIITGFCGQLNLAHGGFFAIGAYVVAILTVDHGWAFWPAFVASGVFSAVFGFLVGIVSLRLKEHYFAIFTLCVGFIIYLLLDKWEALTHGSLGIINIAPPEGFGLIDFTRTIPFYYLVLFFLVLAIVLVSRISSSLVGRTFLAIRISDDLAQSLGINLMRNKVLAFVLSTVYAGLAGGLYAGVVRFIGPAEAEVVHTFDIITYLLVGGIGTLMGPLVGTMAITWLTQAVQSFEEYRMIVFGPMLVLLVIFMPKGVVGTFLTWRGRRLASKAPAKEGQTRVGDSATSSKEASDNA